MVVYVLYLRANLEGVYSLSLKPGANLCISVRNPLDHDQTREKVVVDTSALEEPLQPGSHKHNNHLHHAEAPCHFALKWDHGDTKRATIPVLGESDAKVKKVPPTRRQLNSDDSGKLVPLLAFDCQGVEPFAFHPMGDEIVVTSSAGRVFDGIELSNGDWTHFDLGSGSTSVLHVWGKFK